MKALAAPITALAQAMPWDVPSAILEIPENTLEDDYKSDPEKACRKALRLTREMFVHPERRLRAINRLLGMHGVESVRFRNGEHAFSYANTGDSYACTVVLFASGTFRVTSWGDIVERSNRYA